MKDPPGVMLVAHYPGKAVQATVGFNDEIGSCRGSLVGIGEYPVRPVCLARRHLPHFG